MNPVVRYIQGFIVLMSLFEFSQIHNQSKGGNLKSGISLLNKLVHYLIKKIIRTEDFN